MCSKIYFKDAFYLTFTCDNKGNIIERDEDCTLERAIYLHGEPVQFKIMIGV